MRDASQNLMVQTRRPPGEFERVSAECENDPGMAGLKGYASYQVCMKKHGWFLIEEPVQ